MRARSRRWSHSKPHRSSPQPSSRPHPRRPRGRRSLAPAVPVTRAARLVAASRAPSRARARRPRGRPGHGRLARGSTCTPFPRRAQGWPASPRRRRRAGGRASGPVGCHRRRGRGRQACQGPPGKWRKWCPARAKGGRRREPRWRTRCTWRKRPARGGANRATTATREWRRRRAGRSPAGEQPRAHPRLPERGPPRPLDRIRGGARQAICPGQQRLDGTSTPAAVTLARVRARGREGDG